jgi:ribosomal protein S18 acetylase RimI-like enzyme
VTVIRGYRPDDLDDLYRICLETGASGQDATSLYSDPRLIGHVFAAPYGLFEPALAFVAEDEAGVGGYVLGALDSRAFQERLEAEWWPPLRARYADPAADGIPVDEWTTDQRMAHSIHRPESKSAELLERYPSHLHLDLLPRLQGQGEGRRLIGTLLDALRARGSCGVHFVVGGKNQRAVGFYRHLGLPELEAGADFHLFGVEFRTERF